MNIFLEYLFQAIAAFVGTVAFCILFSVPIKQYFFCGFGGIVSWLVYYACEPFIGAVFATFFATLAIVLYSRIFAIIRKCPVTVFLVCGIIPLVPGSAIYYTAYYFFMDDMAKASHYGLLTFKIAMAIVMGMVVVLALPIRKRKKIPKDTVSNITAKQ